MTGRDSYPCATGRRRIPGPPTSRNLVAIALVLLAASLAGCSETQGPPKLGALAAECGLRQADEGASTSELPREFLPARSELVDVHRPRIGGMSAVVNLAYSVEDAFDIYRAASESAGFEVTSVDFEGFEAEIWLRNRSELGSIVVRGSACEEASGAIISIVAMKDLEG